MKVICIDAKNKPSKIPAHEWIKEGEVYTVTEFVNMALTPGKLGFLLKEVQLSPDSFPYEYYSADRFAPFEEVVLESEEVKEAELDLV
jgi:hypothetical protein